MLLNKANLLSAEICSKEESRYTLNAVAITERETVALDGHRLIRVTLPDQSRALNWPRTEGDTFDPEAKPNGEPWLLSATEAKRLLKSVAKKTTIPVLCHAAVTQTQSATGRKEIVAQAGELPMSTSRSDAATGRFPAWAASFPTGECTSITLDPALLAGLLQTIAKMGAESVRISVPVGDAMKPIRIDADLDENNQVVHALLMPMRSDVKAAKMKPTDVVESVQTNEEAARR